MALFKNKWEIKTWAELSASVGDSTNALQFRPKHRLPYDLQQGAKASKNATGFFNRESILTVPDYPNGFYIYDAGSGASYTATPKAAFKLDITAFLNSSSLSSAAKTSISASFNGTDFPSLVIQIDSSSYTSSATASAPAIASWTIPAAVIGTGSGALSITNTSTNTTNIWLKVGGTSIAGRVYEIEYTLPMETITFTPNYDTPGLALTALTGSEYTPTEYNNSVIYTPEGGSEQTSSVVGKVVGSGSLQSYASASYSGVEHTMYLKALGDGSDSIYEYTPKTVVINFPTATQVVSASYKRYAVSDTSKTSILATSLFYFVSGSTTSPRYGAIGQGSYSGSHIFTDAALTTPAPAGIYVPNDGATVTGYLVPETSETTRVFSGQTY